MLVRARSHNYAILPPIHSINNIYELKLFLQWNLKFFAEWRKKWGEGGGRRKRRESQRKTAGVRRERRKRQAKKTGNVLYVWRIIVKRCCNHSCRGNEAMRSVFIVEAHVVFHSKRNKRGRYIAASSGRPFLPYSSVLTHVLKSRIDLGLAASDLSFWRPNWMYRRSSYPTQNGCFHCHVTDVTSHTVVLVLHCYTWCRCGNYTTLATIQPTSACF